MAAARRVRTLESLASHGDSRVILNVGGTRFETQRATLKKLPATRLSKLTPELAFYDPRKNEYFFDRHPGVFSQILNYYRTGRLHYPTNVCGPLFEDELSFWGIQREDVEPCCWKTYTKHRSTQETLEILDSLDLDMARSTQNEIIKKFDWENDLHLMRNGRLPKLKLIRAIIWQLFEEPHSSRMSKTIALLSISFIVLSILAFVLKTLLIFQTFDFEFVPIVNGDNQTEQAIVLSQTHPRRVNAAFDIIEWICHAWFTFEIVLRFFVAPSKRQFCSSMLNWIDFLGSFWFFCSQILQQTVRYENIESVLDLISTILVARMFKICRLHPRLKVIITSVWYSSSVLGLLLFFFLLVTLIAGSLIHYFERLTNSFDREIVSVIDGIWFATSTISTLGFGDVVPKSLIGMIFGAMTTIAGVLVIDLPMPIVVEAFANFNSHLQARQQLPKQRRRITSAAIPRKIKPLTLNNKHLQH